MEPTVTPRLPLLLLDVDGVVFPLGQANAAEQAAVEGQPARFTASMRQRLDRLAEAFSLIWATRWEDDASRFLAPALSLPWLAFIRFPPRPAMPGQSDKLSTVKEFVGDRPLAWLDDEVGEDMHRWARRRRAPTLIRAVDPRIGLSESDVEVLLHFAQKLRGW
jgi:hypothetical protein